MDLLPATWQLNGLFHQRRHQLCCASLVCGCAIPLGELDQHLLAPCWVLPVCPKDKPASTNLLHIMPLGCVPQGAGQLHIADAQEPG